MRRMNPRWKDEQSLQKGPRTGLGLWSVVLVDLEVKGQTGILKELVAKGKSVLPKAWHGL